MCVKTNRNESVSGIFSFKGAKEYAARIPCKYPVPQHNYKTNVLFLQGENKEFNEAPGL
jgi:hypothetical protein